MSWITENYLLILLLGGPALISLALKVYQMHLDRLLAEQQVILMRSHLSAAHVVIRGIILKPLAQSEMTGRTVSVRFDKDMMEMAYGLDQRITDMLDATATPTTKEQTQ